MTAPGSNAWLEQVTEDIIDPDLAIIDPHHHLWHHPGLLHYHVEELQADQALVTMSSKPFLWSVVQRIGQKVPATLSPWAKQSLWSNR